MALDIDELRSKAEAGSRVAQSFLGEAYLVGDGVEHNYAEALRLLTAAAEGGAYRPMAALASMYEEGLGTPKNLDEAHRLYKGAALNGNVHAAYLMARKYGHGYEVPESSREVIRWCSVVLVMGERHPESDEYRGSEKYLLTSYETEDVLIDLLKNDPEVRMRRVAALVIGQLNLTEALPALFEVVDDPAVRHSVADAFGYVTYWKRNTFPNKSAVTELLLRLMDDPDSEVRISAANSIGNARHNNRRTRARLWQALEDPEDRVQQVAGLGLARFGDREILPWLEAKLTSDGVAPHHIYAAEALGDTTILPAVLIGGTRLLETMQGRQKFENQDGVQNAIDSLKQAATASST